MKKDGPNKKLTVHWQVNQGCIGGCTLEGSHFLAATDFRMSFDLRILFSVFSCNEGYEVISVTEALDLRFTASDFLFAPAPDYLAPPDLPSFAFLAALVLAFVLASTFLSPFLRLLSTFALA